MNTYMLDLGEDNPLVYSKSSWRENNKKHNDKIVK